MQPLVDTLQGVDFFTRLHFYVNLRISESHGIMWFLNKYDHIGEISMTQEVSKFCDKLIQLRREKGYSQEQLADYLNVSRQAVSKWEADQTMPALDKLVQIADIFGVSVDYLIRENAIQEEKNKTVVTTTDDSTMMEQFNELKTIMRERNIYDYKSKTKVFGIPLVHVRFSTTGQLTVAKGIIAVGSVAIGVVSLGAFCFGLISFGAISIGLLLAIGAISLGTVALGAVAVGILAIGAAAFGVYAMGASAIASSLGVGAAATGKIAIGEEVHGQYAYHWNEITRIEAQQLIRSIYPHFPDFLVRLFTLRVGR